MQWCSFAGVAIGLTAVLIGTVQTRRRGGGGWQEMIQLPSAKLVAPSEI